MVPFFYSSFFSSSSGGKGGGVVRTLIDFDITSVWDRTQEPHPEADGMVPKKDDFYLIFSLGINF